MGEEIFTKLRYCFAAGYTLPQFCVDKGIKTPLFVLNRSSECFLKEIYAQFRYDKRMQVQLCFLESDEKPTKISLNEPSLGFVLKVKNFNEMKPNNFDKIIFLTEEMPALSNKKYISLANLEKFFVGQVYVDIPCTHFLQRHPDVKVILVSNFPNIKKYEGGAAFASKLWNAATLRRTLIASKGKHIKTPFDKFGYTNAQVAELLEIDKSKLNMDGTTTLIDVKDPLKQIIQGKRATAYQPEKYLNKIHLFGPCHYFGRNAPFDKTIASYLQHMLNESNLPYRVENEGQAFVGRSQDMFYNLNKLDFASGDIIFLHIGSRRPNNNNMPVIDISDAFDPPVDYREIFCTKAHVNELGYKILAEKFFKFLTAHNFFRDTDFKYPPPQSTCSPLWYTTAIRTGRLATCRQRRAGGLQATASGS